MASVNKVTLIGNLGQDPEVKYMPSGGAVVNISIATSESWKDKSTGENKEKTEWHRVVFFNRLAEIVGEYLKKGSSVYVEGSLTTRKWEKNGVDQYTTEIKAREMKMLGDQASSQSGDQGGYQSQSNQPKQQAASPASAPQAKGFDDFNDDIPF